MTDIIQIKSENFVTEEVVLKVIFKKKDGSLDIYQVLKTGKEKLRMSK